MGDSAYFHTRNRALFYVGSAQILGAVASFSSFFLFVLQAQNSIDVTKETALRSYARAHAGPLVVAHHHDFVLSPSAGFTLKLQLFG